MKLRSLLAPALSIIALSAIACGNTESAKVDSATSETKASSYYPQTVTACDTTFEIDKAPERIMFHNSTGASTLVDLGLLDRVVARFGVVETSTYDAETQAKFDNIEVLDSVKKGGGHYIVSTEAILEKKPDLLIASTPGDLDVEKLYEAGVAVYIPEAYCSRDDAPHATFEQSYKEIKTLASVFEANDKADEVVKKLKEKVSAATTAKVSSGTATAVFVTPGDSTFYVYGNSSMVQAQFEAIGWENVYDSESKRVFKISMESLLEKNPENIVILHQGDAEGAIETFTQAHGASELQAVKNNKIIPMPFPLTDPPSSLSIEGLQYLHDELS
ncbi:ABC transporter substrate-binding protein [Corynebacterium kutscheri]|uniref:ABC transporter n=1 Tax=Corynebacterium kutscheri TaxID=35755 RepID=A0AB38VUG8_9CORY|nr:ABC transporter substrate-binding protein [Corynebacterium kutscheri]VEH08955.1 ABC transporter [Corynebacterium kutscheri]